MKEKINIFYSIDHKFLELTMNSINSVRQSFVDKNFELDFYLVSKEPLANIPNFVKNVVVDYSVSIPQMRFIFPEHCQLDRLIYLDSDTICTCCISKLWKEDLGSKVIGAVHHRSPTRGQKANQYDPWSLGTAKSFFEFKDDDFLSGNLPYFNSGVMVIDCRKWRDMEISKLCVDAKSQFCRSTQPNNDEPILNHVLRNNWKKIDQLWNFPPNNSWRRSRIIHMYGVCRHVIGKPSHKMFK
tara:strand:- start:880 stop:1602 length:723 start_codon:yes stop_codon:yes gene_type:complete